MNLAVVTPWSTPMCWTKGAENVGKMLSRFNRPGWSVDYFLGRGIDPASRHVDCCIQALNAGADAILFLSQDQIHPPDMLNRLVDRFEETGGDVISALVPFRGYVSWQDMRPFQPMGWRVVNPGDGVREFRGYTKDPDMFRAIDPADGPFQRIDIIGSGVLMFHRDSLLALDPPWFFYERDPFTMQRIADMDTRFVWRLVTEAGTKAWVDTTIMVKHLHPFEIDDTWQDRFADWESPQVATDDIFRFSARAGDAPASALPTVAGDRGV